ncbi:MAG: magnesium and cobalt exporter, family [Bacteroidota bacterium]|nr:magnesium and cobalt exporter, family [Bacteroidota bacterium]
MLFNILLTLFFVFLNGFFVAAEFAIVKVRASQVELRLRSGSRIASITKSLINHMDSYLSATQLGITLASLGLGWIGESVVSDIIMEIIGFVGLSISSDLAHSISLPSAFAAITILHIVFGELAPKSLAIARPEQVAMTISIPLKAFYLVFKPVIWSLNSFANLMLKFMGIEPITGESELHSADELRFILEESSKSGIIDRTEHKLLENVFEFADTPVKQIMVPHNKIVGFEYSMEKDEIIQKFIEEGYSRMPIYKRTIDNILGVIYAKDLINMITHDNIFIIHDIIRPVEYVSEDEKINLLLRKFQKEKIHFAVVVDEFGGTAGIVTLEDILEELVGEIQDEYDDEKPIVERISEHEFLVRASATIDDANDFLPLPLPESEDYETVGGLIMNQVGRIPDNNETIPIEYYMCKILKRSKQNLELVKLSIPESQESDE